ncbi:hypothetical protein RQP50_23370 [Paenibacillus sp. chi10]|jgi:hypothetical protein|uniref:Uncharacterized protein n=1 Tax=Paenibacillus suaedae TaxID=3077233 RepID=A0AAJ2JZ66_9BACL|nr:MULTISPECIES: hypothetical protein [Paenibacillus]MDT8979181.1 hypothetical protein [Paenibacillus sp. chi10]GAV15749.1 hypothetical protein PBN151_5733 [Paenibacillus sp. NAIST15-1]
MKIKRTCTGMASLEDILLFILASQIDKIIGASYHEERANTVPSDSDMEGTIR